MGPKFMASCKAISMLSTMTDNPNIRITLLRVRSPRKALSPLDMFKTVRVTSAHALGSGGLSHPVLSSFGCETTLFLTTTADDEKIVKDSTGIPTLEALNDFYGLPSNPLSIYHTGPSWPLPTGPQAQRIPKETHPVCVHRISHVWHELGKKIYTYFDSIELKWTSIDPVRFAKIEEKPGSLFLWVGVLPDTLSSDHAKDVAAYCKEILVEYGFADVEIAFRESIYTRYAGPQLLDHVLYMDPTVDLRIPFTPALGLPIASKDFPYIGGTGCLYLCEGGESNRTFLLTARHVVLPPTKYSNELYCRKKYTPRRDVIHLGSWAFQNTLEAIVNRIDHWDTMADIYERELVDMGECVKGENAMTTSDRKTIQVKLAKAKASKRRISEFHCDINNTWNRESQRILGHVIYAPPISVNPSGSMFTEDWALIELNRERFDWNTFRGNVIYIGPMVEGHEFLRKMYPDAKTRANFKYPYESLMQLRDFVKYDELRHPTMLDANGEVCFPVVKNGAGTGVRFGRATEIESFVREYKDHAIHSTSMEIAIYSYSYDDGAFSSPGDSGSVVADANHRIVGMITGGAGQADRTDVTYLSPYDFLNERIKKAFPHSYLFPT
ncbi:hypothetical protein Clacol_003086 [Clathrus columnatus]|uniref:Peptidase S1 domain-containing protein n=1 Tax=Clathrus columnatus TaxID=1419009 RepID=A0AAV5A2H9_9AGAM|nr:hypothetical protein Clacol_003086 [Clathrus columnatus]